MVQPVHLLGLLGTQLDGGIGRQRWNRWRPSVAACQHEDLLIHRFDLLHDERHADLAAVVAEDIRGVSPETDIRLHAISFEDPWDFEEVFSKLHSFARSSSFDTSETDYLIHITTGTHVQQICLFLLAESRHLPGRLLQTSPPPRDSGSTGTFRIIDLDLSQYDALAARFAEERQEGLDYLKSGIKTRNAQFNRMMEQIERVAIASRAPMLLTGPTGAGKTRLARRIYELKRRREQLTGNLVEVNCATLRGDQAMSTLFGHVRGAFTGATSNRQGLLVAANQGLLFLDEIGELGLDEQAMLLRAVEEHRFLPVGSDSEVHSDFQLLAGTNRNLQQAVGRGEFREDLLARINLWTFCLPGLAARPEDIEPNLDFELERQAAESGRMVRMSTESREAFLQFAAHPESRWPANFRDLTAAVNRMATLARGGRISGQDVAEEISRLKTLWQQVPSVAAESSDLNSLLGVQAAESLDLFDRVQLEAVVRICRQCRSLSDAGRVLFAHSRQQRSTTNDADRLRKYLARFGLTWQTVVETPSNGNL